MRILVIGGGGREHALVWKIAQSKFADKVFCAPGNGGISNIAECIDIKADDIPGLLDFARREKIDLAVVGPEAALVAGVVDEFNKHKLRIFGPDKKAAQLEGSKVFSKQLMAKYNIPTADFKVFESSDDALKYIDSCSMPCVVKADGLAAGKGVVVAKNKGEAQQAVISMMKNRMFGDAGTRVIIEDCLHGEEASILVFTDSKSVVPLVASQDHKRVFDGDSGPNTGGMGAYSPAPVVSAELFDEIMETVVYRAIDGLAREGMEYKGVLYAGIMLTKAGPRALEFNARFGDPETQVILPRLDSDLLEVMLAVSESKLSRFKSLKWNSSASVCVVCASAGYPGEFQNGKEISGLYDAAKIKDVMVFHSGTKRYIRSQVTSHKSQDGYFTNGGRVLGVTGLGKSIKDAIKLTYSAVDRITFEGMHFRKDIGRKAVIRNS